jgi:hypothetical protein
MVSRKKKQGKLRRAGKAVKAEEEAKARQAAEEQPRQLEVEDDRLGDLIRQEPCCSMTLPRGIIDAFWTQPREETEDPWLRLAKRLHPNPIATAKARTRTEGGALKCWHFLDHEIPHTNIPEFVTAFRDAYNARCNVVGGRELKSLFVAASVDMWRNFTTVWKYPDKMRQIVTYCLAAGTESILNCIYYDARFYASFASYFGQFYSPETGSTLKWERAKEFTSAHNVTVISFFKKNIFCSCLDWSKKADLDVEEMEVEEQLAEDNVFAWLDSVLQHFELLFDVIEEKEVALYDIQQNQVSESEIDSDIAQLRREETLLKLELSRHCEQLEEVKMQMKMTGEKEYACLNFALDQLSQHSLLHNLHQEEVRFHWPTEGSGNECIHVWKSYTPQLSLSSFSLEFLHECGATGGTIGRKLQAAYKATKEMHRHVCEDPINMEYTTALFLAMGTQQVIIGNYKAAMLHAAIAYCFEQHVSTSLRGHGNCKAMNWPKVNELFYDPDQHTLVSFFRKRIPCSCLDKKYKEVKSITKLGICYNFNCPHPDRKVERSRTKCCSRCHLANYCSLECQVDNWAIHKKFCQQNYQLSILDGYI